MQPMANTRTKPDRRLANIGRSSCSGSDAFGCLLPVQPPGYLRRPEPSEDRLELLSTMPPRHVAGTGVGFRLSPHNGCALQEDYGQTGCTPCDPGYYCPGGGSSENPCPAGTSTNGQSSEGQLSDC